MGVARAQLSSAVFHYASKRVAPEHTQGSWLQQGWVILETTLMKRRHLHPCDYTVGWVCALPVELAAAAEMLDEEHEDLPQDPNDSNLYTLGRISDHNVVIVCLPAGQIGNNAATAVAAQTKSKFTSMRFGLMVGIGGGVPSPEKDIRLGDVVVSQPDKGHGGVVQYDFGKRRPGKFERTGFLNTPPTILLNALSKLKSNYVRHRSNLSMYLTAFKRLPEFSREIAGSDILFESSYHHIEGPTCERCSKDRVVKRAFRSGQETMIHYGTIASGNQVIEDGTMRDQLSAQLGDILCFEMEAAGLMNSFPCLVIRGICDYSDSHKNKRWQSYSAAAAVAYAKDLLSVIPAAEVATARAAESLMDTPGYSCLNSEGYSSVQRVPALLPSSLPSPFPNHAFNASHTIHVDSTRTTDALNSYSETLNSYVRRVPENVQTELKEAGDPLSVIQEKGQLFDGRSKPDIPPGYVARVQQILRDTNQVLVAISVTIPHEDTIVPLIAGGIRLSLKFGLRRPVYFDSIARFIQMMVDHLVFLGRYALKTFFISAEAQQLFLRAYKHLWQMCQGIRDVFVNEFGQEIPISSVVHNSLLWRPVENLFIQARLSIEEDITIIMNSTKPMLSDSEVFAMERDNLNRLDEQRRMDVVAEERRLEKRLSVIKWVSDLDYSCVQEEVLNHRFGSTGAWLLQHEEFKNWFEGDGSSLLWCWGNPGAGKTVLASIVQDHISTTFRDDLTVGTAFVYCTYREPRRPDDYIKSYVRQLLAQLPNLPEGVEDRHYELHPSGRNLSLQDLGVPERDDERSRYLNVFTYALERFKRIFLMFDALDECEDRARWLIPLLVKLVQRYLNKSLRVDLKIFITSRRQADIVRAFKAVPTIEIRANDVGGDIEAFVNHEIRQRMQEGVIELRDEQLVQTIVNVLSSRADGMFLWVKYQLDYLCEQLTEKAIFAALDHLPETLQGHYDRVVDLINKQSKPVRDIARHVIEWLACSARMLYCTELLEAIAVLDGLESLGDLDVILDPERLVHACHNLVSISSEGRVSFVHYSVREYFTSEHLKHSINASLRPYYLNIDSVLFRRGTTCLAYLCLKNSNQGSFWRYAAKYFPHHLNDRCTEGMDLFQVVKLFQRAFSYDIATKHAGIYGRRAQSAIELAAQLGLSKILDELLKRSCPFKEDLERALRLAFDSQYQTDSVISLILAEGVHIGVASPRLGSGLDFHDLNMSMEQMFSAPSAGDGSGPFDNIHFMQSPIFTVDPSSTQSSYDKEFETLAGDPSTAIGEEE